MKERSVHRGWMKYVAVVCERKHFDIYYCQRPFISSAILKWTLSLSLLCTYFQCFRAGRRDVESLCPCSDFLVNISDVMLLFCRMKFYIPWVPCSWIWYYFFPVHLDIFKLAKSIYQRWDSFPSEWNDHSSFCDVCFKVLLPITLLLCLPGLSNV